MTSGSYQLFNCFNSGFFYMGLGVPPMVNNSIICLKQLLFFIRVIHKRGHMFFWLHKKVQETLVLSMQDPVLRRSFFS
jgi:hypothetical protein